MAAAVFLDRDGTMVRDVGYLSRREDLYWFSYTLDAIRLLNRAGFLVVVITNQAGIALEFCTETFVQRTHEEMAAHIAGGGGRVDGWYYCPHHPMARVEALRVVCDCRKPAPGMVRRAQADLGIDLDRSFAIGDKGSDLAMARAAGVGGILVRTGYGESVVARHDGQVPDAAFVAADLMEATSWILGQAGHPRDAA